MSRLKEAALAIIVLAMVIFVWGCLSATNSPGKTVDLDVIFSVENTGRDEVFQDKFVQDLQNIRNSLPLVYDIEVSLWYRATDMADLNVTLQANISPEQESSIVESVINKIREKDYVKDVQIPLKEHYV